MIFDQNTLTWRQNEMGTVDYNLKSTFLLRKACSDHILFRLRLNWLFTRLLDSTSYADQKKRETQRVMQFDRIAILPQEKSLSFFIFLIVASGPQWSKTYFLLRTILLYIVKKLYLTNNLLTQKIKYNLCSKIKWTDSLYTVHVFTDYL